MATVERYEMPDFELLMSEFAEMAEYKTPYVVEWYSWPQMFASTSGPRHGVIGGQAFTKYQVFAFDNGMGDKFKWCCGVWKKWNGEIDGRW